MAATNRDIIDLVDDDDNGTVVDSDEDDNDDEPTEMSCLLKVPLAKFQTPDQNLYADTRAVKWKGMHWMVQFGRRGDEVGFFLGYEKALIGKTKTLPAVNMEFRAHILDREGKVAHSCRPNEYVFRPPNDGSTTELRYDNGRWDSFKWSDVITQEDGMLHMKVARAW